MRTYRVKPGDCLSSLAQRNGLTWDKLWGLPENQHLKDANRDPNILYPGDIVYIPDKERRQESAQAGQRHRYSCKTQSAFLRIQVLEDDEPRPNVSYELIVEQLSLRGTTDGDGFLEEHVPSKATRATLIVEDEDFYEIAIGALDPIETPKGVQERLQNLGYYGGKLDGSIEERSRGATLEFQARHGLAESGEPDDATRAKLVELNGS